jgi:hypothetical protein
MGTNIYLRLELSVGTAHTESSASQSQYRNRPLLSNGTANTFPRRHGSWINNPSLGKTYNKVNVCLIIQRHYTRHFYPEDGRSTFFQKSCNSYEATHCHNPERTVRMSVSSELHFININYIILFNVCCMVHYAGRYNSPAFLALGPERATFHHYA